ncbi:MAG: Mo-dependent nitrogenase C-terminal domain-containing protein [Microcoleaceae cyanobacterium]
MVNTTQTTYTPEQTTAWLRGLLTLAWIDGRFDEEEKQLIISLTQDELLTDADVATLEPISPQDLAIALGKGTTMGENFLRTAVMVALADGIYSFCEDEILQQFCLALELKVEALDALKHTIESIPNTQPEAITGASLVAHPEAADPAVDLLAPVKSWLEDWDLQDPKVARFICKLIPPQCPFERDVKLFGRKIVHIPPMCKLNPLYEQLVGLRFRALSYLADDCGEDVSKYC